MFFIGFLFFSGCFAQFIRSDDPCFTITDRNYVLNVSEASRTFSCWRFVPDTGIGRRSKELKMTFDFFDVPVGSVDIWEAQYPTGSRKKGTYSNDNPPETLKTKWPAFLISAKTTDTEVTFTVRFESDKHLIAGLDVQLFVAMIFLWGFVGLCVSPILLPIFENDEGRERCKCVSFSIGSIIGGFFMILFMYAIVLQ